MGPDNPWSPQWQPDESGQRFRRIFVARRGAAVAGLLWIPVALVATWQAGIRADVALLMVAAGSAGVALLGAGLAPAAVGSWIDAVVAGVAMAVGAPVAAVTSLLIAGWFLDLATDQANDVPSRILRLGVRAVVGVAPLVILAVVGWVVIVRRYAARLGLKP
jgi:hypothetical protein